MRSLKITNSDGEQSLYSPTRGAAMITGAHAIVYSTDAESDRAFLRNILKLTHVDVGDGWLIFGLPPSEVAIHPSDQNDVHEIYLICDDVDAFVATMKKSGVACS